MLELTPADGAAGVLPTGKVAVRFNEGVTLKSGSVATLRNNVSGATQDITPTVNVNKLSLPYSDLDLTTSYTLTLPAGSIADLAGNVFDETLSITFTTSDTRPVPPPVLDSKNRLWYHRPATYWEEALPIGNGHLGAMISSAVECDTLFLNEDTFWSGSPYSNCNANALGVLDSIRQALWQKDYEHAQRLGVKNIVADRNKTGHGMAYEAVGRLLIKTPTHKEGMYRRWLDLSTATAGMSYEC